MNKLKTFWTNTKTSTKLLVAFTLLACGPEPLDYQEYFSLFFPQNATRPENTDDYFYSSDFYYSKTYNHYDSDYYSNSYDKYLTEEAKENVSEWSIYLKGKLSKEILADELYGNNKVIKLSNRLKVSHFEASKYLNMVSDIENLAYHVPNKWNEDTKLDTIKIIKTADKCLQEAKISKDEFIKERYFYQAMVLHATAENHNEVINIFNQSAKFVKRREMIYQWQKCWVAGSRMALGDTGRAVLEFAEVFHDSPSKRHAADLSVRLCNNNIFDKALQIATTPEEVANICALNAIQPEVDGLELAEKISKINPNHEMLELIISREINKNELDFYAYKNEKLFNSYGYLREEPIQKNEIEASTKKGNVYLEKLLDFTDEMTHNEEVKSKNFWNICTAYLNFMKNDNQKCKKILNKLNTKKDSNLLKQVQFLEFMIADKTFSIENEAKLIQKIDAFKVSENDFRVNNMKIEMSAALHKFYLQMPQNEEKSGGFLSSCSKKKNILVSEKQQIKAFLAINIGANPIGTYGFEMNELQESLIDTCSSKFLEKILTYVTSKDLTKNEKLLIKMAQIELFELEDAISRIKFKDELFEEALATVLKFEEIGGNADEKYINNVAKDFEIEDAGEDFSYVEYHKYLVSLKKSISNKKVNAQDFYNYGKGIYNLSYYGKATEFVDRYRSNYELEYNKNTKNNNYYTTQNAKKYFEKALALNPDSELGAKITYALALCQRNEYWVEYYAWKPSDYEQHDKYLEKMTKKVLPKYQTYLTLLHDKYADTQYQKMLLKECATYRDFVGK
jgi:hypothetical protein